MDWWYKKKKYQNLENENKKVNDELKKATKEKKEIENNYRVLIEHRKKKWKTKKVNNNYFHF